MIKTVFGVLLLVSASLAITINNISNGTTTGTLLKPLLDSQFYTTKYYKIDVSRPFSFVVVVLFLPFSSFFVLLRLLLSTAFPPLMELKPNLLCSALLSLLLVLFFSFC